MKWIYEGRCGRGAVRQNNQDNLFVNGQWRRNLSEQELVSFSDVARQGIYAVCDGMGGESFGEEAALLATQSLYGVAPKTFFAAGAEHLCAINLEVCRLMRKRNSRIGTTFVGLTLLHGWGRIINIGDSRAYRLRNGRLEKLSRDHTQIQRLIDAGVTTPEQARTHPDRHKLTQHLGVFPEEMVIEPYVSKPFLLRRNDIFLLCSDGLTDMLTEQEIAVILQSDLPLSEKTDRLYESAMRRGGKDNITVVLVQKLID